MDPCLKATSSISEDLKQPPTLLQLSGVINDNNQCKMKYSISNTELNGCEVEKIDTRVPNCVTDNVNTIVTFPSSNKKIRSGCMMMSGHGVIASSNLFLLDSYQDLEDINSKILITGTIICIPRKHANYWTIHWDNNSSKTNIHNKSLWS